jgi:hypothetical protein
MFYRPGRAVRAAMAAVTSVALVTALGACSDGGSEPDRDEETSAPQQAAPGIPTKATIGLVKGRIKRDRRKQLERRVTKTVDRWIDAAYVAGDYPRTDFSDAFATFSKDAAALAKRDRRVMSNAKLGDRLDSVTAKTRRLRIDVLAHNGAAAGVTGRFVLVLDLAGEVRRKDRIAGSLYLTYTGKKWKVFGYDVKRGTVR